MALIAYNDHLDRSFTWESHAMRNFWIILLSIILLASSTPFNVVAGSIPGNVSGAIEPLKSAQLEGLSQPLDIASRLQCRQAVEDVYWQHRLWPEENQSVKPTLAQVLSPEALRARVEDELRKSNALEQLWQRPITGAQLQAEIERMINSSRQPQVLVKIFSALNNNAYLVAECLARPVLADRLIHSWHAGDERFEQDFDQWWQAESGNYSTQITEPVYEYKLTAPVQINAQDDTWTPTLALPEGVNGSTAIWTGTEMIMWGGLAGNVGTYTTLGDFYHVSYVPNNERVATPDSYTTGEDTLLSVPAPGVLENDTDADGDSLIALLASNPVHGSLNLVANGSFTYTPEANFYGSDSFSYRATDGMAYSIIVVVTISVMAINDSPIAAGDAYSTNHDIGLVIAAPGVLSNDVDADGDSLSAVINTLPQHGSLMLNTHGSFTYMPEAGFSGVDQFSYQADDGSVLIEEAVVMITVEPAPGTFQYFYLPFIRR
jgi:VCBS repeat-containing protein